MALSLSILYRGPLSSCNYACAYCPFAKRRESAVELNRDRAALARFLDWVTARPAEDRLGILFTPWGEALTRRWYRDALVRLTGLPQVVRAAVQTNLSCGLSWVDDCDRSRLALWATFHPTQVSRRRFLAKCRELDRRGARYSVGVVGLREHFAEIEALRNELSPHIYLWINAYKDQPDYYRREETEWLASIDPLFPVNNHRHPSLGRACRAGNTVVSVDGDGTVRRCHFIRAPLGNLYDPGFERVLAKRPCTNATCGCHIGYVHMPDLGLDEVFGDGVLERIPAWPIWQDREADQLISLHLEVL
jgi:MoaA/NifB/PqqE/SkfB family radical SAM enzyme